MTQRRLHALAPILAAALLSGAVAAQGTDSELIDSARATLDQWVDTQRLISKEKEDWRLQKDVLEQRIELIESEIAALRDKIDETRGHIGESDAARRDLDARNDALQQAGARLAATIGPLESRVRGEVAWLPGPLRERIAPLAQRIPADPATTELSLSARYQNVIGVLNEINKFNRVVTTASEVRQLPDGTTAEVRALYLGLGQGYYVTKNAETAGIGRPGADGWVWTPADEIAPEIARAIAILENEQVPAYVPLPVTVE